MPDDLQPPKRTPMSKEDLQLNQELADAEVELAGSDMPTLAKAVADARLRLFGRVTSFGAPLSDDPSQLVLAVQ